MSFLSPHFAQMFFDPLHCRQWMWYACFTVFCLQVTLEIKNWSKDDPIATIFIKRSINHLVSKKINRIAVCAQVADTSSESAGMEINRTAQEVSFPLFFTIYVLVWQNMHVTLILNGTNLMLEHEKTTWILNLCFRIVWIVHQDKLS